MQLSRPSFAKRFWQLMAFELLEVVLLGSLLVWAVRPAPPPVVHPKPVATRPVPHYTPSTIEFAPTTPLDKHEKNLH